jgi:serine/threonine protein kinase
MTDHMGQQLGNYRLSRLLGKGGFAEVYLGEHVYLKMPVAIKLLGTKVVNEQDLQAFLEEAQTIAQLVHPHIVRILDFGVDGEIPFLVMDYAAGGTLRQHHPHGKQLHLTTIVPYIKQVSEALQYAHEEKFIHRDVKPENMLVGRRDEVLLSDFGIALIAQSSRHQSTSDVLGTVAYMSPEQIQGKPRPASDQYSLGIIVYEWLSGTRPFHGSFTELCTQHMFAPPPSLSEKVPALAPAVEEVVMTALAKDPKSRFGSVQAFANALEQAWQTRQTHGSATTVLWTPFISVASSMREPLPSDLAQTLSAPTRRTFPDTPRVSPSAQPVDLPKPSTPKSGRSRGRTMLLIGMVLLVISGSLGLFSTINIMRANNSTHATTTAWANLTATAQAYAIARAYARATAAAHAAATATAHAAATATIIAENPDSYLPPGMLALYDPLSNNGQGYKWDEGTNSGGDGCKFVGGVYHAKEITPHYLHQCVAEATDFNNFTFEVRMTIIKGGGGGIIFRADNATGKWYDLDISQSGQYSLFRFDHFGAPVKTLASGFASAFKTGLNQTNLIAVVANRSTLDLYVNHQKITSTSDNTHSHGEIGVLADYPLAEVVYSNAKVWTLP